jgi:hypothetical protein
MVNYFLGNMFQHKYLIYNRDCTLLTYAVQTKIKIDDQATYKDVNFQIYNPLLDEPVCFLFR